MAPDVVARELFYAGSHGPLDAGFFDGPSEGKISVLPKRTPYPCSSSSLICRFAPSHGNRHALPMR
jgi:hypothetical protein